MNTYFDDPFRMMRRECDWNADPYFMGLLLPNAEHLPEVVTQDFMFQRGQERAMQLATHFFEHPLPAAQGAIEMLCHHAAEAEHEKDHDHQGLRRGYLPVEQQRQL